MSMNNKTQVVYVNRRLKRAYNTKMWKPKQKQEIPKVRTKERVTKS